MPTFHYEAQREDGEVVSGQTDATDVREAIARLEADGLQVVGIRQGESASRMGAEEPDSANQRTSSRSSFSPEQWRDLAGRLMHLIEEGQPLAAGLAAYAAELPAGRYRRRLEHLAAQLRGGVDLETVLASQRISPEWITLLSIAADSSEPARALANYLTSEDQTDDVHRRLCGALLVWLGILLGVCFVYLVLVVPIFANLLTDFETEFPPLTFWSIQLSKLVARSRGSIFVLPLLGCAALWTVWRFLMPQRLRDRVIAHTPIAGRVINCSALSRFGAVLAPLIEHGLPLPLALRLAGHAADYTPVATAAEKLAEHITAGGTASDEPPARGALPATLMHVLQWEQPPAVKSAVIAELASWYRARALGRSSNAGRVLHPLFIVLFAWLVLLMFIAVYLPLFSLLQNLSG